MRVKVGIQWGMNMIACFYYNNTITLKVWIMKFENIYFVRQRVLSKS